MTFRSTSPQAEPPICLASARATGSPLPRQASEAALNTVGKVRKDARRRPLLATAALLLGLVAAIAVRVLLGSYTVTIPDFFTILSGGTLDHARGATYIVMEEKLPRAVLGALAGACFGLGGAIFQLLLRNPIASPDIIGVSNGAALGAVIGIVFLGLGGLPLTLLAILVALAVAVLILGLSAGDSGAGNRFILVGLGISALSGAFIQYVLSRVSTSNAQTLTHWLAGSLSTANWTRISLLAICFALLVLPLLVWWRPLHATAVGEELARGLGVPTGLVRTGFIALGVLLVAVATAATGPLAFIAFMAGPIARAATGGSHSLINAALVGAIVVIVADFIGSNAIPGVNLPAGVLTGAFGAPALIWLLARTSEGKTS
ncbi:FecCD family ABC transporter permease [Rothia nasimurium]|uniref:FecCD family ABC transporter permease n=1 Tax=Rothia nasimurium TaxID=85336 RepID=UPI003B9E67EF